MVAVGVEFDGLNGESPCVGLGFVERTHKRERVKGLQFGRHEHPRPIGKDCIGAAVHGHNVTFKLGSVPLGNLLTKGLFSKHDALVEPLGQIHGCRWSWRQKFPQIDLNQATLFNAVNNGFFHLPKLRHGNLARKD